MPMPWKIEYHPRRDGSLQAHVRLLNGDIRVATDEEIAIDAHVRMMDVDLTTAKEVIDQLRERVEAPQPKVMVPNAGPKPKK